MLGFILPFITHWQCQVRFKLWSLGHFSQQEQANPKPHQQESTGEADLIQKFLFTLCSHFRKFLFPGNFCFSNCSSSQHNTMLPTHVPKVSLLRCLQAVRARGHAMEVQRMKLSACVHPPAPSRVPTCGSAHRLGSPAPCCRGEAALQHLLVAPLMPLSVRGVAIGHPRPCWTLWWGLETSQYLRFQSIYKKGKEKREGVGGKQNPDGEREHSLFWFCFERAFFLNWNWLHLACSPVCMVQIH